MTAVEPLSTRGPMGELRRGRADVDGRDGARYGGFSGGDETPAGLGDDPSARVNRRERDDPKPGFREGGEFRLVDGRRIPEDEPVRWE
jgi:hypothetical protein